MGPKEVPFQPKAQQGSVASSGDISRAFRRSLLLLISQGQA